MGQQIDLTGYKLTFADEFDGFSWNGGGNSGTWNTTFSYGERKLNDELEVYSDRTIGVDPFSVRDGALVITAAPSTDLARTLQPYTSGVITTYQTFAQTYGYFEMRAKLPAGQGLWPAFWLLPVQHVWPPELDVMEAFGSEGTRYHWGANTATSLGNAGDWVDVPGVLSGGYHRYGVAWTADTLTYYFDGVGVAQTATPADMNQPMYLLANLAVGGHWPGNPVSGTAFPAEMLIDYIRAYSSDPGLAGTVAPAVSTPDAGAVEAAAGAVAAGVATGGGPVTWLDRTVTVGTDANDHLQTFYGDTAARAGGLGDDTYVVTDPRMDIVEAPGAGVDTVEAWVDYTLPAGVENLVVKAGWGLRVTGNAGSNIIAGETGDDTIDGGPGGDDRLSGGGGRNLFVVSAGSGRDTITDFAPGVGHDRVLLDGFSFATPEDVLGAIRAAGVDSVLQFANGETLTFWGVQPGAFTEDDFVLSNVTAAPRVPVAAALMPDKVSLFLSQDAYGEDARFTVAIDGRTLGGAQGVSAIHGAGEQRFDFAGLFGGAGPHTVALTFLNDAWGGVGRDRNLHFDSVSFNGAGQQVDPGFYFGGTQSVGVVAGVPQAVASVTEAPAGAHFSFTNTASGVSGTQGLQAYAGPVDSLRWQGMMQTGDDVAISTESEGVFLVTGAGNDAIAVQSGDNVLDGGSGSNFLVGGTGRDTFFLDARGGVTTWNTIVGFHAGDMATIWGFSGGDGYRLTDAPAGALGFEGATLRATVAGVEQSLTFAGVSGAGAMQFGISTGVVGGVSYMLVQSA